MRFASLLVPIASRRSMRRDVLSWTLQYAILLSVELMSQLRLQWH